MKCLEPVLRCSWCQCGWGRAELRVLHRLDCTRLLNQTAYPEIQSPARALIVEKALGPGFVEENL